MHSSLVVDLAPGAKLQVTSQEKVCKQLPYVLHVGRCTQISNGNPSGYPTLKLRQKVHGQSRRLQCTCALHSSHWSIMLHLRLYVIAPASGSRPTITLTLGLATRFILSASQTNHCSILIIVHLFLNFSYFPELIICF